jgi:hypothetical protein
VLQTDSSNTKHPAPAGTVSVAVPLQGTVVVVAVSEGGTVRPGQQIAVVEAMKMEHLITATQGGIIRLVAAAVGDTIYKDDPIVFIEPAEIAGELEVAGEDVDLNAVRNDLAEMLARQAFTIDENWPDAITRRRKTNQCTTRENIAALVDEDNFIEYGSLALAAQRARRTHDDLIRNTPTDGLVAGLGTVNGSHFDSDRARCMVIAYDYTVLAGTQGQRNHKKQDRMFRLAEELHTPVILFAEGGGGRPGDTERLRYRSRRADVRSVRQAQWTGATGRRGLRPLLCRQCRAAWLLRRHHRDEGYYARHGRTCDDRRWWPWRLQA